jgi:hypothetical protein
VGIARLRHARPGIDTSDPFTLSVALAVLLTEAGGANWIATARGRMEASEVLRGE